jgi:hypothetical protein
MTKTKYKNPKFHIDFADLEVELRKSIKHNRISERLGTYILKIIESILASSYHLRTYTRDDLDLLAFDATEYIVRKLLVNYDVNRKSGFAFIKKMALNRIKGTKRTIHNRGLTPMTKLKSFNRKKGVYETTTFLSINYE